MTFLSIFAILASCIYIGSALECYVCANQDGNFDKCVKTVQTCDQFQDWCLSEVKWGSLPYFQHGADKMFYISKQCATKEMCERTIRSKMPLCDRIWYNDWECAECCQGDRCNYYITLGAMSLRQQTVTVLLGVGTVIAMWWRMRN